VFKDEKLSDVTAVGLLTSGAMNLRFTPGFNAPVRPVAGR